MQRQDLFSADEPEVILPKPRFGEEEERRARPVMPLSEGEAQNVGLNRGPQVAFRGRTWRSSSRNLTVALALVFAAVFLASIALYTHFTRANPTVTAQPTIQTVAVEPTPAPQSSAPHSPAPPAEPSRTRRTAVVYVPRSNQEDYEDKESEGDKHKGKKRRDHEGKGDDEKQNKRDRKVHRVDIKVRH